MRLSALGEFGLIARITSHFTNNDYVVIGSGDDAALVDFPDGDALISTDVAVEGVHFRNHWSTPHEIGRRIAAQNLADIAAMGGHPVALTVALTVPPNVQVEWVEELTAGIAFEAGLVGASVVGGDLARGTQTQIAITALGQRRKSLAITRAGASVGEIVAIAGDLGWSAAGLACLSRGQSSPAKFVNRFRVPEPPYSAGPLASRRGATAMIDTSDGLLADVGHIAAASEVAIDLFRSALEPSEELVLLANSLGLDAWDWVLTGGEDHCLVAVFPPDKPLPKGFRAIGKVVSTEAGLVTLDGKLFDHGRPGHDHFA